MEAKCVTAKELLDEVMAVYEKHGYTVRRVEKKWRCDGEPTEAIADGILPESERHYPATFFVGHDGIEEAMCITCLFANAEGWME